MQAVAENGVGLLQQQLSEAKRKMDLLRTVSFELNKVLSLKDKLYNILKILHDQFHINYSMMLLPDEAGKNLVVQCSYGYEKDNNGFEVTIGTGIAGLAALRRIPINITGIRRKRQYLAASTARTQQTLPDLPGLASPESQIAIPLVANNELVAVLLAESYNISVFSKDDEAFLITLSQSIAVSIQNALLFDTMEESIAKRTEELRRSNETKDRLFSVISHDLRGPITSFHNIARLVSHYNKQNEREKIDQLSQRIDQSVDKLNTLLDNLLSWALTQTREIQCRPAKLSIGALLQEVLEVYADQLLLKEITPRVSFNGCLYVNGDYNMLTSVFRNLISNAIKYTPRGGTITLEVEEQGEAVHVTCADTGVGIDSDKLPCLFEAHEKKSTRGTENEKGTGLGLLVVKEFIALHQGTISINSTLGKGTSVHLVLPKA